MKQGLVERNVAAFVKPPRKIKVERQPWTVDEIKAFLRAVRGDRMEAPYMLSLMGLRPGEVCGLRWDGVDFDAGTLTVSGSRVTVWSPDGGDVKDGRQTQTSARDKAPKTASGCRTLPVPKGVLDALRGLRTLQKAERLRAGAAYEHGDHVLRDELGRPYKPDQFTRAARKAMRTAGVRECRWYDCRHACLTILSTSGVPPAVVSAWAGHADLSLALSTYTHPTAQDLLPGRDVLDGVFG